MTNPPAADEAEISLFGPGLGESAVIHLGAGEWMIVDSCRNPQTKRPVAMDYLHGLGIEPREAVSAVGVTHWDSDHIRGMGQLVQACRSAAIWCTAALDSAEFATLVALERDHPKAFTGRLREIAAITAVCTERGEQIRYMMEASMLLRRSGDGLPPREVHVLSPSFRSKDLSTLKVRGVLDIPKNLAEAVKRMSSNDASAVMMVTFGTRAALLGADLEDHDDDRCGWVAAIGRGREVGLRADFVKIPHHGSQDADHDDIWTDLLTGNPAAAMTPFRSGSTNLPKSTDRDRIRGRTDRAYLTSSRARITDEQPLLYAFPDAEVTRLEGRIGHVRWRRRLDETSPWEVAVDEVACPV